MSYAESKQAEAFLNVLERIASALERAHPVQKLPSRAIVKERAPETAKSPQPQGPGA